MFRRIESNGKAVWYFEPQSVYVILLLAILLAVLIWIASLPFRKDKSPEKAKGAYLNVFESRIISLIRQAEKKNVSSSNKMKHCGSTHEYINNNDGDLSKLVRNVESLTELMEYHGDMTDGSWKPRDCIARHRVAVVIPYRNRESHLVDVLSTLLPLLKAQNLHFRIYLAEQDGVQTFNKGVVMNAAFLEALKDQTWDCFVFHDVDLLPENIRIQYSCPKRPRHLSAAIDEFGYILPYDLLVGGVLILRTEDFIKVNGYSNVFWGWGAEDDDMEKRIRRSRLRIDRLPYNIARYHQIEHKKREPSSLKMRYGNLITTEQRMFTDGVSDVKYKLVSRSDRQIFTRLLIDVGSPPNS